jgi:hypothetical protein
MSGGVLSVPCNACRQGFKSGSELKYHIKRDHQQSVKVTFAGASIINIERGNDGMFRCTCNRSFSEPNSIRRQAKCCRRDAQGLKDEGNEDIENELEESDLPADCMGKNISDSCWTRLIFR